MILKNTNRHGWEKYLNQDLDQIKEAVNAANWSLTGSLALACFNKPTYSREVFVKVLEGEAAKSTPFLKVSTNWDTGERYWFTSLDEVRDLKAKGNPYTAETHTRARWKNKTRKSAAVEHCFTLLNALNLRWCK